MQLLIPTDHTLLFGHKITAGEGKGFSMGKNDMARLSWWAHWYLPRGEAENVVAGYGDKTGAPSCAGAERPRDAAKKFVRPQSYYVWLGVFIILSACAVIPVLSSRKFGWNAMRVVWGSLFSTGFPLYRIFLAAGVVVPLLWFRRRKGDKNPPLHKPIAVMLAILVITMGIMWWMLCDYEHIFFSGLDPILGGLHAGELNAMVMKCIAALLAAVGVAGLVNARAIDRRWRAVYVLSLTVLMMALKISTMFSSLDISSTPIEWAFATMVELTVVGIIGTVVSLC